MSPLLPRSCTKFFMSYCFIYKKQILIVCALGLFWVMIYAIKLCSLCRRPSKVSVVVITIISEIVTQEKNPLFPLQDPCLARTQLRAT